MKVFIMGFEEDVEEVFLSKSDMAEHELSRFQECEYREFAYCINHRDMSIKDAIMEAKEYAMINYTGSGYWYIEREIIA